MAGHSGAPFWHLPGNTTLISVLRSRSSASVAMSTCWLADKLTCWRACCVALRYRQACPHQPRRRRERLSELVRIDGSEARYVRVGVRLLPRDARLPGGARQRLAPRRSAGCRSVSRGSEWLMRLQSSGVSLCWKDVTTGVVQTALLVFDRRWRLARTMRRLRCERWPAAPRPYHLRGRFAARPRAAAVPCTAPLWMDPPESRTSGWEPRASPASRSEREHLEPNHRRPDAAPALPQRAIQFLTYEASY
jgi:hypothetical protein